MAKKRVSFKESVEVYNRLIADIRGRRFAPIYLLMGEESYFIDSVCDALATTVLTEAEQSFNQITLYGRDCEGGVVVNYARQVPMMGGLSVVIVKEAQQLRSIEKLVHYTSAPSPTTVLILCHKEKSLDKRSQLYKSISSNGVVLESMRPRDYEIGGWLTSYLSGQGLRLTPKALAMLTDNIGGDISKIVSEVSKLIIALPEGQQVVGDDEIERHIGISKEFNNYELCNAVVNRDKRRALRIADHFSQNPKAYPLLLTVLVLFNQFKQLFTINYLRWMSQNRGATFPSDMELMRILKVGNPYAVSELKQTCGLWHNRKVYFILGLMREYDAKSKGMNRGSESDGELLRELLLKIFAA
ncbi:MAG: DNA polymerase III subunit delta [Rikenellaceae bacterium]